MKNIKQFIFEAKNKLSSILENIIYDNNRGDYTATQYTQIPPAPEVASLMKY